jgi:hypothetical protein
VTHRDLSLAGEGARVDLFAAILAHQQVAERGRAGQAADVGRQDALVASLHLASCLVR